MSRSPRRADYSDQSQALLVTVCSDSVPRMSISAFRFEFGCRERREEIVGLGVGDDGHDGPGVVWESRPDAFLHSRPSKEEG